MVVALGACAKGTADASSAHTATSPSPPSTLIATATSPPRSTTPPPTTARSTTPTLAEGCDAVRGFDTVGVSDLPDEAIDTLDLIDADGPFPFDQDGAVFQNRERILPRQPRGYYHEYTVVTPGSDDRGARRIVTGDCGERFYTDDHYDSFRLIEGD